MFYYYAYKLEEFLDYITEESGIDWKWFYIAGDEACNKDY